MKPLLLALVLVLSDSFANCRDVRIRGTIDQEALLADLYYLASDELAGRKTGMPGAAKARRFLQKRYTQLKLKSFQQLDGYLQPFARAGLIRDLQGINVVGYVPGATFSDRYIVITAHYDHLGKRGHRIFNGADDNASGVAAMLAIAASIQYLPAKHSVVFVATDAEELGLYGAKAFLQQATLETHQILVNLNLDMLSQPGRSWHLYATPSRGNTSLSALVEALRYSAGVCFVRGHRSGNRKFGVSRRINWHKASDHAAFAKRGIPYVFVGVGVHSLYHTEKDRAERVPIDFYAASVETALSLFRALDELDWTSTIAFNNEPKKSAK